MSHKSKDGVAEKKQEGVRPALFVITNKRHFMRAPGIYREYDAERAKVVRLDEDEFGSYYDDFIGHNQGRFCSQMYLRKLLRRLWEEKQKNGSTSATLAIGYKRDGRRYIIECVEFRGFSYVEDPFEGEVTVGFMGEPHHRQTIKMEELYELQILSWPK